MHIVIVDFTVKPEAIPAFGAAMLEQARTSLETEAGCRQFDVAWPDDDPGHVHLYEVYDSPAAFETHLQTGHFKRFDALVAPMIVDKQVCQMTRRFP